MSSYALLSEAIAANSPPATATDGVELRTGFAAPAGDHVLVIKNTAGTGGTMSVTIKLWGYYGGTSAAWHPIGTHATDATRGIVNGGVAIGEHVADKIRFAQTLPESSWGLRACDRIYAEITNIAPASLAISAWLLPLEK